MEITIHRIARECGVSASTVSRVFNNHPNVRRELRERVIDVSRKLGYSPRGGNRKKTIAVIVPGAGYISMEGYLGMILSALCAELEFRGYGMEIVQQKDIELLNQNAISGAISVMFQDGIELKWGREYNIPLVCLNSESSHVNDTFSVGSNEEQGMMLAVGHLHAAGHRRLGLIYSGNDDNWCNRNRVAGYIKAQKSLHIEADDKAILYSPDVKDVYEPLGRLLKAGVTGLICAGESFGPAISYAMDLFGCKVPQDISVISWEKKRVSEFLLPPHTTLCQDFSALCAVSLDTLEALWNRSEPVRDRLIDYKLIERDSVASPNK